jgi:chitosanase
MSVTPQQRHVIDCIIAIFETGRIPSPSAYATCTILKDGAGISYGKHQCTDRAGSLDNVVKKYIELGGEHAATLQGMLPLLASNASCAEKPGGPYSAPIAALMNALKAAGADPKMHQAQDEVFDRDYWMPAVNMCKEAGLTSALAHAVVYDTCIHSGPGGVANIRRRFPASPPAKGGDEKQWVNQYLKAREEWLLSSANELVRKTTYRMDAFQVLAASGNWDLATPLVIRGCKIA